MANHGYNYARYLGVKIFVHLYRDDDYDQLKKLALRLTKPQVIGIPLILRRLKKDKDDDALQKYWKFQRQLKLCQIFKKIIIKI